MALHFTIGGKVQQTAAVNALGFSQDSEAKIPVDEGFVVLSPKESNYESIFVDVKKQDKGQKQR